MGDNPNNRIVGNGTNTLINKGNTIKGAGQLGSGGMQFANAAGSVIANGTNALAINLGSGIGVNKATMSATGSGGMVLMNGIFTNNGNMTAGTGSSITYQSGMINTNLAEGVLVGGTWQAVGTGVLSMTGGSITVDDATLVLNGVGSVIQAGNGSTFTPVEQTLTSIVAGAQLQVLANRGYANTQNVDDSGTIQLGGGTFHTNALTVESGALLKGFGTVNGTVTNNGKIEANGGTLTVTGNVTGTGTLQADAAATLILNGASNGSGSMVDNGTVILGTGHGLTVSGNVTGTGTLRTNTGAVLIMNGAANGIGTVVDNGTISLGTNDNLTVSGTETVAGRMVVHGGTLHAGSLVVAASGVLFGSGSVTDAIPNSGRIEANGGTLTITGAVLGGALQADSGAALALKGAANTTSIVASVLDNGTVNIGASDSLSVTAVNSASTGVFVLTNASLLKVAADTGHSNQMSFLGASGDKLVVDAASFGTSVGLGTYTGPLLENFGTLDSVDLKDLPFAGLGVPTYKSATGLLQLLSGANHATLKFQNSTLGSGAFHTAKRRQRRRTTHPQLSHSGGVALGVAPRSLAGLACPCNRGGGD